MAIVEVRGMKKYFGDVRAVDGVDFSTEEGEFLVILGPSGSGKTTLMRMVAGLEVQTEGDIYIGGRLVNDLPPRSRKIAMVFQSYALYPHMTVFKNIAFPLRAHGVDRETIQEKVRWAASLFGIEGFLNRKPRELSGGERQRVALARALVREPDVFLLDEPLSNLDAKLRNSARVELQEFQKSIGTTTIYVTHDQIEAMGLGDRIAVMNWGKIRQLGTPQEVYNDPADTFVAGFLGAPPMNLVDTGDVILGVRPEHFHLEGKEPLDEKMKRFTFRVLQVENLGSDRFLYGVLESPIKGENVIVKLPYTVSDEISKGETVVLGVREENVKFFDKNTGVKTSPKPIS